MDHIAEFMRKSSKYREPYEQNWQKCLNEYLNTRSVKQNVLQRANLKIPYAFTTIETFTPQLVEAFFGDKPYIQVRGRDVDGADDAMADLMSDHLTYELDQTRIFTKSVILMKSYLVYGTMLTKNIWVTKTKNGRVIYDGPDTVAVELQDFYPDWRSHNPGDIQSMRGCVHRVWRTLDEIKAKRKRTVNGEPTGIYFNITKLEQSLRTRGDSAWKNMSQPADDDMSRAKERMLSQEPGAKTNDSIELWEYWGLFDLADDGNQVECVITVANGDTVIRVDENPFTYQHKPFTASVDYPIPGEFYGVGEIMPVLSLIKEGTALRNARLDQTNQAVNRMWLVDRNSGINVRNLYNRPGGIILANDINGIKPLEAPDAGAGASRDTAQIDFDIQNATANTNASQSVSNIGRAFGRTKAGIDFMQGTTSSRMVLKVRLIEDQFIKETGHQYMLLNQQFLDPAVWRRLYGTYPNPYDQADKETFCKEYDYYAVGAMERLNKQQRQQVFAQVMVPFMQNADKMKPHTVKWDGVISRMFKEFDWRNTEELINSPQEQAALQQQDIQAQMQMQQQQQVMDHMSKQSLQSEADRGKIQQENVRAANKAGLEVVKGLVDYGVGAAQSRGSAGQGSKPKR